MTPIEVVRERYARAFVPEDFGIYEVIRERYAFPFELRPYQVKEVNDLSMHDRIGKYWEPGTGKTAGSTHWMLQWNIRQATDQWLLILPPILVQQWGAWLRSVTNKVTGKPLSVTEYVGTPKKRKALSLDNDFIVTSMGLFKNDFEYLYDHLHPRKLGINVDEATSIKNTASDNHKAVKLMAEGRHLALLTGTPVNKPGDTYAYVKLVAPLIYPSLRRFENIHVEERDEWGNVTKWKNMDLMASNLMVQSSRILRREVRKELPDVIYTPITYELASEHRSLYKRIADERLVEFEGRNDIDAISASGLRSALQQVIVNWGEFDGDESRKPAILDVIEETFEEIGDKKLVIVANFRRSNRYLLKTLAKDYGAVAVFGDIPAAEKQRSIQRFTNDPSCRAFIVHPESAGFGLDGLQKVCSDMLVVEAPSTPTPFQQVVARLDRDGQEDVVCVRVAIAAGTVQVKMFRDLLEKDRTANVIQRAYKNLRDSIYGE